MDVHTDATVTRVTKTDLGLHVDGKTTDGAALAWDVVDESMATGLPHVWAAGDCVVIHHRLLGTT